MKPIYCHLGGALALSFTLAACVPAPDSTPAPSPAPTPVAPAPSPAPTPAPTPAPVGNWIDQPQTAGTWRWSGNQAAFVERTAQGSPSSAAPMFVMECRKPDVRLLARIAAARPTSLTIRTETTARTLQLTPATGAAAPLYGYVDLPARDPLLDAMAVTRGRFAVETPGQPALYLPPWAEVTRIIEQCR